MTGWDGLEAWLREELRGQMRKGGHEEIVEHSVRIGRALRDGGYDDVTVFGGYCHDVLEDVDRFRAMSLPEQDQALGAIAAAVVGNADAHSAVELVRACSYSLDEEAEEKRIGGKAGKRRRKELACQRWLSGDIRTALVKRQDVRDNKADAAIVGPKFEAEYAAWADPLADALDERIRVLTENDVMFASPAGR